MSCHAVSSWTADAQRASSCQTPADENADEPQRPAADHSASPIPNFQVHPVQDALSDDPDQKAYRSLKGHCGLLHDHLYQ